MKQIVSYTGYVGMGLECEKIVVESDEKITSRENPCCTQCGEVVLDGSTCKTPHHLLFCDLCRPIKRLKETWRPISSGSVSRIFRIA